MNNVLLQIKNEFSSLSTKDKKKWLLAVQKNIEITGTKDALIKSTLIAMDVSGPMDYLKLEEEL